MTDAEVGSAARKRKKTKPPTQRAGTGLEVVEPLESGIVGQDHDHEGVGGIAAKHTFQLDYKDRRGYVWTGTFTCHVLTIKERSAVGLTRSRLTANTPSEVIDQVTLNILEMQAHLAVALDASPDWAKDIGALYDVGVVGAIYKEVASHEARFWGANDGDSD